MDKVCGIHFHEINNKMVSSACVRFQLLHSAASFIQVECKKAQPKEVMYAQQMAKGKAALQRGAYGDILSEFIALALAFVDRRVCFPRCLRLWFKS